MASLQCQAILYVIVSLYVDQSCASVVLHSSYPPFFSQSLRTNYLPLHPLCVFSSLLEFPAFFVVLFCFLEFLPKF